VDVVDLLDKIIRAGWAPVKDNAICIEVSAMQQVHVQSFNEKLVELSRGQLAPVDTLLRHGLSKHDSMQIVARWQNCTCAVRHSTDNTCNVVP
jgi:hypothetical protein